MLKHHFYQFESTTTQSEAIIYKVESSNSKESQGGGPEDGNSGKNCAKDLVQTSKDMDSVKKTWPGMS